MHNCKKVHPKKSHRRRNRRLKKERKPLQWWTTGAAYRKNWGREGVIVTPSQLRPKKKRGRKEDAGQGEPGRLVQIAPAVALRDPSLGRRFATQVAKVAKKAMPFRRKSG